MMRHVLFLCVALCPTFAQATEVKEVISKGGLTAWLVEDHALPLIAVNAAFRDSGYAYDIPGKEGRANMTAAMLTEGAGDMDSRAFNEALESSAIQLGAGADDDAFSASVQSLSEHKEKAFTYLGLMLTRPRFDDDAMERTRRQTLSIIARQQQNPGYLLSRGWRKLAFGKHPYSHAQLGLNESVAVLSRKDLQDFTTRYLTKENIVIAVVGDITPAELGILLDAHLGALPAHYAPDAALAEVALPTARDPLVIDFDIPQTMVAFGANGIKRNDPDYIPSYVMNQILGGGGSLNAKLGQEIREKRGLAYSVATALDPMAHSAQWRGEFATRNEKVGEALEVLRTTTRDFTTKGPSDQELNDAKQYLTGSFVLHLDSNESIADFLINMQMNHLGRDYLDKRNAMVEAVTKKQVMDSAARLIDADKLLIVMIGKPQLGKKN